MRPEIISLVGGSALLIYSISELSKSVELTTGARFRVWLNSFGASRLVGFTIGIFLALMLSSSSAVTVMLVNLANSRLLTLEQVFSVALGSSIGTTFLVHIIAFKLSSYGLLILAFGVILEVTFRERMVGQLGRCLLFLGLVFFSLTLVADAGVQLQSNELFRYLLDYFRDRPLVSIAIATILTAVIQSSSATIAFVMSLMASEHSTIYEAIPWVLGANLGSAMTAFFGSLRSGVLGRQAALGQLMMRLAGVAMLLPLTVLFGKWLIELTPDLTRQIAFAHTFFNIGVAIVFLPLIPLVERLVKEVFPSDQERGPFHFQFLNPHSLRAPELALAHAQREILRMSDTVQEMLEKSVRLFKQGTARDVDLLREMDRVVDFLNKGIRLYLTKLTQEEMSQEQVHREFEFLLRTNDLENIGDIIDKNIMGLVRKNAQKGYVFSDEGWNEILAFHAKIVDCLVLSTAFFNSRDPALLTQLHRLHADIKLMRLELMELHIQRLHEGVKQTVDTTSVHLDLLGHLQRISELSVNFTYVRGADESAAKALS